EGRRRLPDDELLRRVRRPGRRHAHVQQLRAAPKPAVRHRYDHHAGADAARGRARRAGAPTRFLLLHRRRAWAPHGRCARHRRRPLRLRPGREHLDGGLDGEDPPDRRGERLLGERPSRRHRREPPSPRRDRRDGAEGRVREARRGDRLGAQGVVGGGHPADDRLVCREPRRLDRARRLAGARGVREVTRVLVTGGGGFVGSHLVERLEAAGHDVFVARSHDYDLTRWEDAERLFADARRARVCHLAAEVGGIGANRANPGRYWYANLMMGAHVLELARQNDVQTPVVACTVCSYPKFTPVPFHEDELWNGYPEETNAPYGVAK